MTFKKGDKILYTLISGKEVITVKGEFLAPLGMKSATVKLEKGGGHIVTRVLKDKLTKLGEQ